jgi:hypothetical protein
MIVDGRGGAEVRCRESHQDHRPGEYVSGGVIGVQVRTSSQRRVCELSLCPSVCSCEEKLQLKRVTVKMCTVFCELCPCPRGVSWLRPAWVR